MNNAFGREGKVPETLMYNSIIDRDYSLTQEQDYRKNILPYKNRGYQIQPMGTHRFGYYILTAWRVHNTGSNRY
jgi:hypothetical protein